MDIDLHCLNIIKSPRIRGRIVVLCEGDIPKESGRRSPGSYVKNEHTPDSNFYKACLPEKWKDNPPIFINSGSRAEVIKTYERLPAIHDDLPVDESCLSPHKIFAIIDIDLHSQLLSSSSCEYPFIDIDCAFNNLYESNRINTLNAVQHRIWFTGLIHKEAYFLIPELQDFFDEISNCKYQQGCHYQNNKLKLDNIYQNMADDIINDKDLADKWARAASRIEYCRKFNLDSPRTFQESWQQCWRSNINSKNVLNELAYALLAIRKAKPYWQQVHPDNTPICSEDLAKEFRQFREEIALKMGRQFYSRQTGEPHQHLACFFRHLYEFEHSQGY
jgi:hypothetical protein